MMNFIEKCNDKWNSMDSRRKMDIVYILGMIVGGIVASFTLVYDCEKQVREYKKEVDELNGEIDKLKNLDY